MGSMIDGRTVQEIDPRGRSGGDREVGIRQSANCR
jgi:hypothetical protein